MSPRTGVALASAAALALALAALLVGSRGEAQPARRGASVTVVVGAAAGAAVTERLDARRTNASRVPLPEGTLRITWTRQLKPMAHPPLVLEDRTIVVVTDQGDALFLSPDGTDAGHVALGPLPVSAPTLLADGTMVVVNGEGDAVGVRRMEVVFRAHALEPETPQSPTGAAMTFAARPPRRGGRHRQASLGIPREASSEARGTTLPLDDGGCVVAAERELVSLDATGAVRARALAPAAIGSPLVAAGKGVVFVTELGDVYGWDLTSASAVQKRGSFGGTVEGAVAAPDDRHLWGVVRGGRLVALDLATGVAETRATASGAFTGALALGPSTRDGGLAVPAAFLQDVTISGTRLVEVDADGRAGPLTAVLLTPASTLTFADAGGGGGGLAPTDTQLLSAPNGRLAYATVDGHVGVVSATTKHELGPLPCGPLASATPRMGSPMSRGVGFAGLVPAGPGAFVVACDTGGLSLVAGDPNDGDK